MKILQRVKNSLFIRLTILLFLGGIGINLLIFTLFHFAGNRIMPPPAQKILSQFIVQISRDIGIPPEKSKAEYYAREMKIYPRSETFSFFPDRAIRHFTEIDWKPLESTTSERVYMAIQHRFLFFKVESKSSQVEFAISFRELRMAPSWRPLLAFIPVTLILLLLYLTLRHWLRPIKELSKGMHEMGSGNLGYRIHKRRNDELGQVVELFNQSQTKLGEMLAMRARVMQEVSHEMRTPLTRMRLQLEFLPESEEKKSLEEEINFLNSITEKILQSERKNRGEKNLKSIQLFIFISDWAQHIRKDSHTEITVNIEKEFTAKFDETELRSILNNLLSNAVRHSSGTTRIQISVEKTERDWSLLFRDHGEGIANTDLPYIFEAYYRGSNVRGEGYGLGLSLVKSIVQSYSGEIHVQSETDKFTEFRLVFPYTV